MSERKPVFVAYDNGQIECSMPAREALAALRAICDDIGLKMTLDAVAEAQKSQSALVAV